MAPILINQSDFGKIGLIIVLVLIFTFAGGFFLGQQQTSLFLEEDHSNDLLPLSEESGASTTELKNSTADVAFSTVTTATAKTTNDTTTNVATAEAVAVDAENTSELEIEPPVLSSTTLKLDPEAAIVAKTSEVTEASPSSSPSVLKDDAEIKFSIQVAVYGNLKNAEKMMKKLQKKHLDAYVSDYVSKQNHVRFNVRFGYFKDKKSAKKALQDYSIHQQGDGYLVNYSADNIVKFRQEVSVEKTPVLRNNTV